MWTIPVEKVRTNVCVWSFLTFWPSDTDPISEQVIDWIKDTKITTFLVFILFVYLWHIAQLTRSNGHFKVRATLHQFWLSTQINCHQGHKTTYSGAETGLPPFITRQNVGVISSTERDGHFKVRVTLNRFRLLTQINCHQGHTTTYSWGWNRVTPPSQLRRMLGW